MGRTDWWLIRYHLDRVLRRYLGRPWLFCKEMVGLLRRRNRLKIITPKICASIDYINSRMAESRRNRNED